MAVRLRYRVSSEPLSAAAWFRMIALGIFVLFAMVAIWSSIMFIQGGEDAMGTNEIRAQMQDWASQLTKLGSGLFNNSGSLSAASTTKPLYYAPPWEMDPWKNFKLPEDWYECIRRNLQLDGDGRPLHAITEMVNAIPLLITPLTGDAKFFPYFICSFDVPVRYHFVILNERDPATVAVVNELERRFGHSGRLILRRNRYNRGYSGSMNQGFEWALTEKSDAEVPWVFACGVDVIFDPGLLRQMIDVVRVSTANDGAMLQALRDEVALEERLSLAGNDSYYTQWAPKGRPLKVLRSGFPGVPLNVRTAPLLPDRIRHMIRQENRPSGKVSPSELRRRYFGQHVATVVPVPYALGTLAITRLALSAGGFFDENFFPAYMDDIDFRWRHYSMGFSSRVGSPAGSGRYHHYNGANLRGTGFPETLAQQYGTEENYSKIAFRHYIQRGGGFYNKLKYGPRRASGVWNESAEEATYVYAYFNISHYPLDTFVVDDAARRCMFEQKYNYGRHKWRRPLTCHYDPFALLRAGILGTEQAALYQALVTNRGFQT